MNALQRLSLLVIVASLISGSISAPFEKAVLYPINGSGDPGFGYSLALSSDGLRALVGAYEDDTVGNDAGAVYVYDLNPSNASDSMLQTILYPSVASGFPFFGFSVAISSGGTRALIGAIHDDTIRLDAGATYVFDSNSSNTSDWTQTSILYPTTSAGDFAFFGCSVALSSDGTRVLIGSYGDNQAFLVAGSAYVFDVNSGSTSDWTRQTILYPSNFEGAPRFGWSVALSSDGMRALVGAFEDDTEGNDAGSTYVYDANPNNPSDWNIQSILYPTTTTTTTTSNVDIAAIRFGYSVALSSNGSRALIGAINDNTADRLSGATYVFGVVDPTNPGEWVRQAILYPSNGSKGTPRFGRSVALSSDGTHALVGAYQDDTRGTDAGAAYVFVVDPINASDWAEQAILYPSKGSTGSPRFGQSVALSSDGSRALVGAWGDDTEGTNAGATYAFDACTRGTILNAEGTACEPCPSGQIPNGDQTACTSIEGSHAPVMPASSFLNNDWMAWFY